MENKRKEIGNKAAGLYWLKNRSFSVPSFSVIPFNVQAEFLMRCGVDLKYGVSPSKIHEICKIIDGMDLSALAEKYSDGLKPPYSVRSSSVSEDGIKSSGAGRFKTVLSVEKQDLPSAIKTVWKSGFESIKACTQSGGMAVIIQEMCLGQCSGVCLTRDPLSGASVFVVETVLGKGEELVSGRATPKTFYLFPNELKSTDIGAEKTAQLDMQTVAARRVAAALLDVEKQYGMPADIEFTVQEGTPVFLQIRPMTALARYSQAVSLALLNAKLNSYSFYVKRDFVWLVTSVQAAAGDAAYQKRNFFQLGLDGCVIANGAEYYSDEYLQRERTVFSRLFEGGGLWAYAEKIKAAYKRVSELCGMLESLPLNSYSDDELHKLLIEFLEVYKLSYSFMLARPDTFLEEALISELKSLKINDISAFIETLTYCDRQLLYLSEMRDFLLAASLAEKAALNSGGQGAGRGAYKYFTAHARRYGWLNSPLSLSSRPFSAKDYALRAEHCKDADKRLLQWQAARKQRTAEKNEAYSKLCGRAQSLAELLSEFRYLRTFTAENSDRLFFIARRSILKEFAKRNGVSLFRVLMSDIDQLLSKKIADKKTAAKRRRGKLFVFERGAVYSSVGKEADIAECEFRRLFNSIDEAAGNKSKGECAFNGVTVCRGQAQGKVRVVKNCRDATAAEDGEIIITSMLTPDLTMCFFKAAGIITEEGGITCHAAIIAREYNIPCVTGVKGILDAVSGGETVIINGGLIRIQRQDCA